MEQQLQVPKHMTIGEFCKSTGLSRWHFQRMCDKYHLELIPSGMSKLVDVDQALAVMENRSAKACSNNDD